MADLRALLGDCYDGTIEKARRAIEGDAIDYLGCGCCTSYDYDEAVKRTGHGERAYMAARDALARQTPVLLAAEAALARVRKLADRIDRHTEVEPDPAMFRDADTGVWWEVSDAIRAALDVTPGGE